MNSIYLAYAGPPLLGAFIGYLTNRIAIRMLFRPLKRWRVLGVPVPMTPGVIPSKRHDLAINIGEMVGSHLLTSRDIGAALSEERFQEHLRSLIDGRLNELLDQDLGPVQSLVPQRFQAYFKIAVRAFRYRLRNGVHSYLQSDEFAEKVVRAMGEQLDFLASRPLNEVVSKTERDALYDFIDRLVADLLAGGKTGEWLKSYLMLTVRDAGASDRKIGEYLPETLRGFVRESIERYGPEILQQMARMMAEPPVRERIIKAVRGGVDEFIASLGPIGAMAAGFIDMNVLEDKIRGYFVDKKDDIRAWLENPEVQERFSVVLMEQVDNYLDKPLAALLDNVEEEQLDSICGEVSRQLLGVVRSRGVAETMSMLLRENLEEKIGHGHAAAGEVGLQVLGGETSKNLKDMAVSETVALVRSKRIRELINKLMDSLFDSVLNRPVGILNNLLPAGVRNGITDYAAQTVNRILLREVPGLVESLEIRRIVTAKVDSLDLLRLERLLLSIMEEQFKYINLFGALLGFVIGLANLLIVLA